MNTERNLKVTEIQRFCMHDGPGVRTTVFFKGCPLACAWCHNPETQKMRAEVLFYMKKCIGCGACEAVCPQGAHTTRGDRIFDREKCIACGMCAGECPTGALEVCGKEMTVHEILTVIEKDLAFYREEGGVTLSGGEPFAQGEGVISLLRTCKERGISTAVETCGYCDSELLRRAVPYVDLFLWDIKDTDPMRHKKYTGVSNERILKNLALVNEMGARIRLRCILVNGINTNNAHYLAAAELAGSIAALEGVELIPYHAYGGTKSVFLGRSDSGRKDWIPDGDEMRKARTLLNKCGICVL